VYDEKVTEACTTVSMTLGNPAKMSTANNPTAEQLSQSGELSFRGGDWISLVSTTLILSNRYDVLAPTEGESSEQCAARIERRRQASQQMQRQQQRSEPVHQEKNNRRQGYWWLQRCCSKTTT